MPLLRVKARWNIPGAGTAYSVLHYGQSTGEPVTEAEAVASVGATRTFFEAIKGLLPTPVTIDYMTDVEEIDVATGNLLGVTSAPTVASTTGTAGAANSWSAPSGACITWNTAGLRTVTAKPRRVRGRTFIVPLSTLAYDTSGNLSATALTTLNSAATGLRGNFNGQTFCIFGRPGPGGTVPGGSYAVTGHRITDQSAILRSRRA